MNILFEQEPASGSRVKFPVLAQRRQNEKRSRIKKQRASGALALFSSTYPFPVFRNPRLFPPAAGDTR
ncbi:hypothetical protein B4098_2639 [Heyndrickxia coagulans]|uniref:Uncharacterized protein n=1 Tax=Heyndrickxia coagulans TaxID=1398 RepID=A0A150JQK6_HEYCO|nr:hypothetical protein B4098_2639 [Heyndrickxia coagulans]